MSLSVEINTKEVDCSYYVYLYLKPDNTPFYVGKGKEDRWKFHLTEAKKKITKDKNNLKINTIKKIIKQGQEPIVKFVDINISEEQVFELECFLINEIGRVDLGTGTLTNLTNGGEGASGYMHTEETKTKLSEMQKGKVLPEEHRLALRKPKSEQGRKAIAEARLTSTYRPSEETKHKVSETLKGRPSPMKGKFHSDESRKKMSEQRKGLPSKKKGKPSEISDEDREKLRELLKERNEQIVSCPYCGKVGKFVGMIRWHMENCKEKDNVTIS